jgi:hypothetical protein
MTLFTLYVLGLLVTFFDYVNSLEFHSQPDYEQLRTMFRQTLKENRWPLDGKLDFSEVIKTKSKKVSSVEGIQSLQNLCFVVMSL